MQARYLAVVFQGEQFFSSIEYKNLSLSVVRYTSLTLNFESKSISGVPRKNSASHREGPNLASIGIKIYREIAK